jgi:hypothetical protein
VPAAKVLLTFARGRPPEAPDPDGLDQREFRALAEAPSLRDLLAAQGRYAPGFAAEKLRCSEVGDEAGNWKALHKALEPYKQRFPHLAEAIDRLFEREAAAPGPVLMGLLNSCDPAASGDPITNRARS